MTRPVSLRQTTKKPTAKTVVVFDGVLSVGSRTVPLKVVRQAQSRRMRLSVTGTQLRLSLPLRASLDQAKVFLREHEGWVLHHLARQRVGETPPLPVPFETATLLLAGCTVPLTWGLGDRPQIQAHEGGWRVTLPAGREAQWPTFVRQLIAQLWEQTIRQSLGADLGPCVAALGRAPQGPVRIRRVKSVWGTLSSKNQVMLDIALAMAPPAVLRYVWIHELCHLRVRNHSKSFWAWVSRFCPEWKRHKEWLKANGSPIKAIAQDWLTTE